MRHLSHFLLEGMGLWARKTRVRYKGVAALSGTPFLFLFDIFTFYVESGLCHREKK